MVGTQLKHNISATCFIEHLVKYKDNVSGKSTVVTQYWQMMSDGEWWSRGRAPDCHLRGRWFNPTYRCFET